MKQPRFRLVAALMAACCAAPATVAFAQAPPAATRPNDSAPAANLAERLEAIRSEHDVPALGAALLRNGEIVELAVTGVARAGGKDPVAPEDAWHIGSCSKAI